MPAEKTAKLNPCGSCGGTDFKYLFSGHDYMDYSPLEFKVMKCEKCGLACLNPRPADLAPFYVAYFRNSPLNDIFRFPFLLPDRLKRINSLKKPGKLLDVGCGTGAFLTDMRGAGWDVYGCDISASSCETARNVNGLKNVFNSDVLELDLPDKSFDVITLWHVIEHLTRPRETLDKLNCLLKDNGILILEAPDFSSLQSKLFKSTWFALDVPRHVAQYSPKTLKTLLSATNFTVMRKDYVVNPRIAFVSLRKSLLRFMRMEQYMTEAPTAAVTQAGTGKNWIARAARTVAQYVFNYSVLVVALILLALGLDDSFRVYCEKKAIKK